MDSPYKHAGFLLGFVVGLVHCRGLAADEIATTSIRAPVDGKVTLEWHSRIRLPISGTYSEYRIEGSTDFSDWQVVRGPLAGGIGTSDEILRESVPASGDYLFYRIAAEQRMAPAGNFGDAIYGYATEYSRQLQQLGPMSLEAFTGRYSITNPYLPSISFDPNTARFWDAFNLDPAVHNATNTTDPRLTDYRLNPQEFAVFQTNGFVASQRLGSHSFADAYYKLYTDDLPVFISADSMMHAWHRSFVAMLEEIEETVLARRLEAILQGMQSQVENLYAESISNPLLAEGVIDADYFLAVADWLVTGQGNFGALGETSRFSEINEAYSAVGNLQPVILNVYGADRFIDFSQFKVRGHYETSPRLQNYFRALTWCALADFRFTGRTNDNSLRELAGSVAMNILLNRSGMRETWLEFERILEAYFGLGDALNFAQLDDVLAAANIHAPADVPTTASLQQLHSRIMAGQLGVQNIRNGYLPSPLSREQLTLPRSFAVMPQRLVLDSWALTKVVFDDIIWDVDGIPSFDDKVPRRVPSALDVAFSVFGNDQIVPDLAERISNPNGHPWRDGWPYQHNLAAVRNTIDRQGDDYWTNSVYGSWLACLRELSAPTREARFPQAMRTRGWAMRTLNTQLASWTQLRHDTTLYAKQSYTPFVLCGYPAAFVEPYPEFWQRFREMALRTRYALATLPTNGFVTLESVLSPNGSLAQLSLQRLQTNRVAMMERFAAAAANLQSIAEKQLSHTTLSTNEIAFLQDLVERKFAYASGSRQYTGWYPALFYRGVRQQNDFGILEGSDLWDPLVTDVHTDTFDLVHGDPGSVLHEGVGNVHLAMIVVDCGGTELSVYAGPILSHYEFELGPATRQTDAEWKAEIKAGRLPPQPEWTRSFLVPGTYTLPGGL